MSDQQYPKAHRPVPDHLRGTREGLFYVLGGLADNGVVQKPKDSLPGTSNEKSIALESALREKKPHNNASLFASDDFLFQD